MVDEDNEDPSLNDRILDVFVYAPAGFLLSALDDFPKLAALGRERLGTQVSNARVIGEFAVKAGRQQLKKTGEGLFHRGPAADVPEESPVGLHSVPTPPPTNATDDDPAPGPTPDRVPTSTSTRTSTNGHVPTASSLAIPGFDTLSASQVVQRLDGLSRGELVSARAYEAGTRGRRTILSRIDQLLEERA
jgi:hypothetical protein